MDSGTLVNISVQRFDRIRERNSFYIDKTDFIREWWEKGADVTLIMRPRRFGKTLNMSMIKCFFSCQYADKGELFEGFSIWEEKSPDGDYKYRQLQGIYPVIFLSFANIKATQYKKMEYKIAELIADLYVQNRYLLEGAFLDENEKTYFRSIRPGIGDEVTAGAINAMANFMHRYYGKRVIILLDEYDTPMQEA